MSQVLSENQVAVLAGNIVYCWRKGERYLYIGASKHGLGRVFAIGHNKSLAARSDDAVLEIVECNTSKEAFRLERELIKLHNPVYNSVVIPKPKTATIAPRPIRPKVAKLPKVRIIKPVLLAIDPISWNGDNWIERYLHWGE